MRYCKPVCLFAIRVVPWPRVCGELLVARVRRISLGHSSYLVLPSHLANHDPFSPPDTAHADRSRSLYGRAGHASGTRERGRRMAGIGCHVLEKGRVARCIACRSLEDMSAFGPTSNICCAFSRISAARFFLGGVRFILNHDLLAPLGPEGLARALSRMVRYLGQRWVETSRSDSAVFVVASRFG